MEGAGTRSGERQRPAVVHLNLAARRTTFKSKCHHDPAIISFNFSPTILPSALPFVRLMTCPTRLHIRPTFTPLFTASTQSGWAAMTSAQIESSESEDAARRE